jgi:GH24 family phage-related lysozyme (muramidase)
VTKQPVRLLDLFRYYKGAPHQMAAISELEAAINKADPESLSRETAWFRTWSQAGKTPAPTWMEPAKRIIKEFEGCRLIAYKCAAGVWTIGFGTTTINGRPVQQGDKLTEQQAEDLLEMQIEHFAKGLFKLLPLARDWNGSRVAALISWAFNVGLGAVEESTLRQRLLTGQDPNQVIREELPKWDKANGQPLAGLTRRREAEVRLFLGAAAAKKPPSHGNPLQVPWLSQLDSATDQAERMCFSSSCAMLLAYLRPGTISGPNADDQYLKRVQTYGDTTDVNAQIRALSSFNVKARFVSSATIQTLKSQIDQGIPVPCGYIHRGPLSRPSGGGHWLIVVGYTADQLIVHDPYGIMNLQSGERASSVARFARYDMNDFVLRWSVEPVGPAAYKHSPNKGWALIATR